MIVPPYGCSDAHSVQIVSKCSQVTWKFNLQHAKGGCDSRLASISHTRRTGTSVDSSEVLPAYLYDKTLCFEHFRCPSVARSPMSPADATAIHCHQTSYTFQQVLLVSRGSAAQTSHRDRATAGIDAIDSSAAAVLLAVVTCRHYRSAASETPCERI